MNLKVLCLFLLVNFSHFGQITEEKIQVSAYEDFGKNIQSLVEPSTVSGTKFFDYHSGIKKAFLFNGNFNIPYLISSDKLIIGKNKDFYQVFQFLPEIKVRIFQNDPLYNDKSKPVRTPSYIPKISYLFSHANFWNQNRKLKLFAGISALHHSNGQDGWEFDFNDSLVNIYNGSFSESLYFQFIVGGKIRFKNKNLTFKYTNKNLIEKFRSVSWKSGYEWHPVYFANQKLHKTGLYGGNRVFLTVLFQKNKIANLNQQATPIHSESSRWMMNFEYITDLSYYSGNNKIRAIIPFWVTKKRLNLSLTYYKKLLKSDNFSFFAQVGYFGSDNYNIYFQQSAFIARTGVAFGQFY
jgi:hypothetical protein